MKESSIVLIVIFWILWLLWAIGCFVKLEGGYLRAHAGLEMVLIGILGLKVFGNPLS